MFRLRTVFRSIFAALLVISAMGMPVRATDISHKALRDLRIYIEFESGTGYEHNPDAQEEFRQAAHMGMRMWQSLFPSMHVTWTHEETDANLTFVVGNYEGRATPGNNCSGDGNPLGLGGGANFPAGWSGCSFSPDGNGDIAGGRIYFNTRGSGAPYLHYRYTTFSRQELYDSYVPATYLPVGHGNMDLASGQGFISGEYRARLAGEDGSNIVFHEFGHSLGLGHAEIDLLPFYGIPHPRDTARTEPHIIITNGSEVPALPSRYYGGGSPSPGSEWVGDLRPLAIERNQMAVYLSRDADDMPIAGLPGPDLNSFNFRVVPQDMFDFLPTALKAKTRYPQTTGTIRLIRGDGSIVLANDWAKAITAAELNVPRQFDPHLVSGVYPFTQVRRVAAGDFHTLAIRDDGTLWSWGRNHKGQLGINSTVSQSSPVPVPGGAINWVAVAAGEGFSLGLGSDNSLWAWGDRTYGQLGDGVTSTTPVPQPKKIGGNEWVAISAGPLHALALKSNGSLWGWGYNGSGQLGIGHTSNANRPTQESSLQYDWVSVASGSLHTLAAKADGSMWAWGWNDYGTIGDASTASSPNPVLAGNTWTDWTMLDGGHEHSIALNHSGRVLTWGRNQFQQLGSPSSVPMSTQPGSGIDFDPQAGYMKVSAGYWHSAAVRKDGSLWSWGWNSKGQLGANATLNEAYTTPVPEATQSPKWVDVLASREHTLAEREDKTIWGWGDNTYGQLGTGSSSTVPVNSPVPSLWMGELATVTTFFANGGSNPDGSSYVTLQADISAGIKTLEFYRGSTRLTTCTKTNPPAGTASCTLTQTAGVYQYHIRYVDRMNKPYQTPSVQATIHYVKVTAIAIGAPSTRRLSDEGTSGWMHFARPDAKSGGPEIILELNNGMPSTIPVSVPAFSWSGGWPTPMANDQKNTLIQNQLFKGFRIVLPAAPALRKARIYLAARNMGVNFYANASGFFATHQWTPSSGSVRSVYFEVEYQTAAGEPMSIQMQSQTEYGSEPQWFGLQAVTLRP